MTKITIEKNPSSSINYYEVEYEEDNMMYEATLIVIDNEGLEPTYDVVGSEGDVKEDIKELIIKTYIYQ